MKSQVVEKEPEKILGYRYNFRGGDKID